MPLKLIIIGAAAAGAHILLFRGRGKPRNGHPPPSVGFVTTDAPRKRTLPRPTVHVVDPQQQRQKPTRWALELQLLALQVVLATVATVVADRLYGRALAEDVFIASAVLIAALAAVALLSAAGRHVWQAYKRRPARQQRLWQLPGSYDAAKALAAGQALLAEMGGPKQQTRPQPFDFSGTWDKDVERSDPMGPAMDAMRLNPLVRRGVALVRGLHLKSGADSFEMAVFSAIPWFKVVERYPLNGDERQFKRRDLRRGKHTGHAEVLSDGRMRLHVAWGEPLSGRGTDTFSCPVAGVLQVHTVLQLAAKTVEYRTEYRKRQ